MDNTVSLSVNNDLIVIRKFNDDYYTETLIKGYYSRKRAYNLYEWRLFGGEFKKVIAVTKKNVDGFYYYADVDGNLLHDNDGSIRLYEENKPIEVEHSDTKLEQSISRSKRNILELAMCNDWDYFVTITGDSKKIDRYNVEDFKKRWKKLIHTYNKRPRNADYKIKYLLVPEYHKDGAIHFHGFIKGGYPDDYFINENGYLDFKPIKDSFGWFSASKIKFHNKASAYITKYINKDLASCVGLGKQCYLCSQGLKRPEIVVFGDNIKSVGDSWDFENEHIKKNVYYDDSFLMELEIV